MSQTHEPIGPLSLADLFTRYLRQQTADQAEGLGAPPAAEVVPHEAAPVQPVDPRLAWDDALAVVRSFPSARPTPSWAVPPDWPALVAGHEPAVALAFCVGNFPQLVRNLHPLLTGDLTVLRPPTGRPLPVPSSLLEWAEQTRDYPQALMAAGVLRLARHFDGAAELLRPRGGVPASWQAVQANEEAALAWHRGQSDEALALWQNQGDSVPVLFNRGMAALFLGRTAEVRTFLGAAVSGLPETSAWHHLGRLYLALADARS